MLFFNVELFKTRLMEIKTFIANYKAAFGENTELPIVFWYSDTLENQTEKINGCFFKDMRKVREGHTVSLNADVIGCGGGKFYTGFTDMPERVPTFVSLKEKYKKVILVANLPYYITTQIIEKVLTECKIIDEIVVMVQKEVALKYTSDYKSPLTFMIQDMGKIEYMFTVSQNVFIPAPHVDSAILKITIDRPADLNLYKVSL